MSDVITKAIQWGTFTSNRTCDSKKGIKDAIRFVLENILVEREFEHPDEIVDYIKELLNETF